MLKKIFNCLSLEQRAFLINNMLMSILAVIKIKLKLICVFLSEEEFAYASEAADIIVLPYRKIFSGASGPLGEGVWKRKCIVGPMEGNLGYTDKKVSFGLCL